MSVMNEKKLTHSDLSFFEELKRYTFESKMLTCQIYSSRLMDCSEVSMKKAYTENIMPWELETFSLFSIIYDSDDATEEITGKAFAEIIMKIRNYWHPELTMAEENGTYAETFMMISGLQQFSVQGLILQKLFRYAYFFGFKDKEDNIIHAFVNKFGCEYSLFDVDAFLLYLACCKEGGLEPTTKSRIFEVIFSNADFMKTIQLDKNDFTSKLKDLYRNSNVDYFYGLKLQYLWPIIGGEQFNYIPVPYLVINAVTESMLNRLTDGNNKLRGILGKKVLENYLYDIYSEVSTVTWISKERKYVIGRNEYLTSDVIVCENDYCMFYDTKALSPSLRIRKFERQEIDKNVKMYAEAVLEIYNQIQNYGDNCFSLDKPYDRENIFGVAVVLEDSYISRRSVYEYVFQDDKLTNDEKTYIHGHIKIVSLRQIEHMVLQNTSFLDSLLDQVKAPDRWDDYNYVMATTENGIIPIYKSYVDDLKNRAKAKANIG